MGRCVCVFVWPRGNRCWRAQTRVQHLFFLKPILACLSPCVTPSHTYSQLLHQHFPTQQTNWWVALVTTKEARDLSSLFMKVGGSLPKSQMHTNVTDQYNEKNFDGMDHVEQVMQTHTVELIQSEWQSSSNWSHWSEWHNSVLREGERWRGSGEGGRERPLRLTFWSVCYNTLLLHKHLISMSPILK